MTSVVIDPPLTRWYCDSCHEPIEDPQWATVCWADPTSPDSADGHLQHDLPAAILVVHKGNCDDPRRYTSNQGLDLMLGAEGMQWWASFLWRGPVAEPMKFTADIDVAPVVELFYRLHVPYYEQARRHFNSTEAVQVLDGLPVLTESTLKGLIKGSGR